MLCDTDGISVPIILCASVIPSVSLVLLVSCISSVASIFVALVFVVSGVPDPLSSVCNATSMIPVVVAVSPNVVLFETSSSGMQTLEIDLQSDPSQRAWVSNRESYHITSPLEVCIVIPVPFFSGWI